MSWKKRCAAWLLAGALAASVSACSDASSREAATPLSAQRQAGKSSRDAEVVGQWLLAELLSPGGTRAQARQARQHLDQLNADGMFASLARGLDDSLHGRLATAAEHYLNAAQAARISEHPQAPLYGWFAVTRATALEQNAKDLWSRHESWVLEATKKPNRLGWRARDTLIGWWRDEAYAEATRDLDALSQKYYGCLEGLRLAGPFGRGAPPDLYRHFPAEAPGPWPARWPKDAASVETPRVLEVTQTGCHTRAEEATAPGIFYAETFIELDKPTEVMLAVQGAYAVWVDDHEVLNRDPRKWGIWPKFGVQLRLEAGRHRVLARLASASTAIQVLRPDGRSLPVRTSTDAAAPYSLKPPKVTADPNVLDVFVEDGDVVDPGDDATRAVAAYMFAVEGQHDVASVIFEPLIKETKRATGPALEIAASFAQQDPLFDDSMSTDLTRDLHERAAKKDPRLWRSRLALALREMEQKGAVEGVQELKKLVQAFPNVAQVKAALARLYSELGWRAEYAETVFDLNERFPDHVEALHSAVGLYESRGQHKKADALLKRIEKLDPDNELALSRALNKRDYEAALKELERLAERRPDREDLAARIHDIKVRAGAAGETWKKLEAAIENDPRSAEARMALADAQYAEGDRAALRRGLVDAVEAGAWAGILEDALDLVEGVSELEPYRLDALPIIRAYEDKGDYLPGTAARVLDYAALWVQADGSSRMLAHEVIRIQSPEAISQFAEHPRLDGLVLHMRVIKKDGRILEPEYVSGKPTVTLPHLEVGDYIETEHISGSAGSPESYYGPRWFFREENVAYARSEFVVISPANKNLIVETWGNPPEPQVEERGPIVVHRWRVDNSPAAPSEPHSAPLVEFLPSVHVGWGVELEQRLQSVSDSVAPVIPVDPRIARIARRIVEKTPDAPLAQAKALYRWVLTNVEEGEEVDGRRVISSKQGNRWRGFQTLARSLGIKVDFALARNRLAPDPHGPLSRSELYSQPVMRVALDEPVWVSLGNQYAPFGYVPAELRGMPAFILDGEDLRPAEVASEGVPDLVKFTGRAVLDKDGSAQVNLTQTFSGKYAIALREAFAQLPKARQRDVIESRLFGASLRGARLKQFRLRHLEQLDEPLVLEMRGDVDRFAQPSGKLLVLSPPFTLNVSQLAALPIRQTPLLIAEATDQRVQFKVELPEGAKVASSLGREKIENGGRMVVVRDSLDKGELTLDRHIYLPTGRIKPKDYAKFLHFARKADAAQSANLRIVAR